MSSHTREVILSTQFFASIRSSHYLRYGTRKLYKVSRGSVRLNPN